MSLEPRTQWRFTEFLPHHLLLTNYIKVDTPRLEDCEKRVIEKSKRGSRWESAWNFMMQHVHHEVEHVCIFRVKFM